MLRLYGEAMKTPQVPAMPGMTPLGIKPGAAAYTSRVCDDGSVNIEPTRLDFDCPYCGSTFMRYRQGDSFQCGRHGCYRWSTGSAKLVPLNSLRQDQAELARRKAAAPMVAPKPQQGVDGLGLFSDSARQTDLMDMPGVRR